MRYILVVILLAASITSTAWAGGPHGEPSSPAEARAWKALAQEFEQKVRPREKEIRAYARKIILAIQKGDLDFLVEECVMYEGKDRKKLTRKYFEEHLVELQAAAKLAEVDAPDFADQLSFQSPEPAAGMPGRVHVSFGPKQEPPEGMKGRRFPPRHQLDLYWLGPLMPETNGRVYETAPPGAKPGRWRFDQLTMPYSRTPTMRL